MNHPPSSDQRSATPATSRWPFVRDVLVFQLKLFLGNLVNFVLSPVTIVAALYDVLAKPAHENSAFYEALKIGREAEERINIYGAIGGYHATGSSNPDDGEAAAAGSADNGPTVANGFKGATVDTVLRKVEDVIAREAGKGGTAASIKAAVERAIDELRGSSKKK